MTSTFAEGLTLAREGGIATLTIDRPQDGNRLSPELLARFGTLAEELDKDTETNVVVITGAGRDLFSLGILNPAIRASMAKEDIVNLVLRANRVFDALEALPQVVIAAINGKALAGAVELALACDLRYAAAHATLAMPEATWGGFPGGGAPVRLPRLVGKARALELICSGREIGAAEMERLALVQGVFPAGELMPAVRRTAERIAASGPLAVRGAKRIIAAREEPGFRAARELSDTLRRTLEWSCDVDEGMAAHTENRKPRFTGR